MTGSATGHELPWDNRWRTSTISELNPGNKPSSRRWVLKRSLLPGVLKARWRATRCCSGCNNCGRSCTKITCWSSTMLGHIMPAKCESTWPSIRSGFCFCHRIHRRWIRSKSCGRRSSNSGDRDGFVVFLNCEPRYKPTYSRSWRRAGKRLWPVVAIAQF